MTDVSAKTLEEYLADNKDQITVEIDKILQDKFVNRMRYNPEKKKYKITWQGPS